MDIRRHYSRPADKDLNVIYANAVLICVIDGFVLFDPSRIQVLMLQTIWVLIPTFRKTIIFELGIFLVYIALLWNGTKSCINDLVTASLKTLRTMVTLAHLKALLNHPRLSQSLSKESELSCIGNIGHYAKTDELIKRESVVDLKLNLVIAAIG